MAATGGALGGAGEAWWHDKVVEPGYSVEPTSLRVIVRATFIGVRVVERGNKVVFTTTFSGKPDEVNFSYMRPGEQRPRVDPGYGQPGSAIESDDGVTFSFVLDTTGFPPGRLRWHFWGTGEYGASAFDSDDDPDSVIVIPDRPKQLL